uniref:NADH-ubiquinone oxidoreductase chain 2 n=1 Tax=Hygrotus nigrolineatus TaxID=878038 RepID=A0A343C1J0_9DYTI|nr:NADH dehydrogenase subunit 2 [Hygrotus nigrolineatus]
MFMSTLIMGTLITISSQSWMGTWMGLEINLLSFIPIISIKNNQLSSESSIKYFLVQALASSIFLFSIIMIMTKSKMINEMYMTNKMMLMMMNSAILMKLGAAPFHFWFPEIIEGLNWTNSLILMTWQKIAPFSIISYIMKFNMFMIIIIMISTFIGSIGGLNQISLRKLLSYSSINHIGWMISSLIINEMIWLIYFMIYSIISSTIMIMFNKYNIYLMKQIYLMNNNNNMIKFIMLMNILSLGGLPPFLGFMPKWIVIQNLINSYFILTMFMIMMSLITLFFYIRLTYSSLIMMNNENNYVIMMNMYNKSDYLINYLNFLSINGLILYSILMNIY